MNLGVKGPPRKLWGTISPVFVVVMPRPVLVISSFGCHFFLFEAMVE